MKVIYDPKEDVLSILFNSQPIAESSKGNSGIILDYDREGNVVGIEITKAFMRVDNPRGLECVVRS